MEEIKIISKKMQYKCKKCGKVVEDSKEIKIQHEISFPEDKNFNPGPPKKIHQGCSGQLESIGEGKKPPMDEGQPDVIKDHHHGIIPGKGDPKFEDSSYVKPAVIKNKKNIKKVG